MLSKISKRRRPLISYGYLSVFGRPIDSLALHSLFEFNIVLRLNYTVSSTLRISWICLGSSSFSPIRKRYTKAFYVGRRPIYQGTQILIKDMKFQNYGNRPSHMIISNVFKVDLERDIKFYVWYSSIQKTPSVKANTLRKYYSPNECFKYLVNVQQFKI